MVATLGGAEGKGRLISLIPHRFESLDVDLGG